LIRWKSMIYLTIFFRDTFQDKKLRHGCPNLSIYRRLWGAV
jgi:hypothetical protein